VRLVGALDRHRRVAAVPFQQPGTPEAHGLSVAACEAAAWAVTPGPDPVRYRGAAAVAAVAAAVLGSALPLRVYRLPGVARVAEAAYAWVARHRGRFPGVVPYCARHPERCR
jgi:predicted DCC family thiol-disulfide oxidoreductase YuxK